MMKEQKKIIEMLKTNCCYEKKKKEFLFVLKFNILYFRLLNSELLWCFRISFSLP